MKLNRTLLLSALAVAFAGAASSYAVAQADLPDAPQATGVHPNGPTVVMDTSMGRITCQFFQKQAPKTGQKQHGRPLYNGTIFHRVIPGFMIQGGDPAGTGAGDPGFSFADEFDPNLKFDVPGRLAMANAGPNTNGSQFFITEVPTQHLNQHHTIFGQCDASSQLIVQTIARVQANREDKPLTPVVLKKVTIVREGHPMPPLPGAAPAPAAKPKTAVATPKPTPATPKP